MMKKYKLVVHSDPKSDIESSFKWGWRALGEEIAKLSVRKLRRSIRKQLTSLSLGCPREPERTIRCYHPTFVRWMVSRPFHG